MALNIAKHFLERPDRSLKSLPAGLDQLQVPAYSPLPLPGWWPFLGTSPILKLPPTEISPEFIQLLTGNQSRLFAYALSLLGDREQAQDVMQEINMILWRKADQFRPGTNFGAWMPKVAYFQVMAHRRKFNRQAMFVGDDDFLSQPAAEAVVSCEVMEQQQAALQNCLTKFPDRQRDIVRRHYFEGASIKVVAEQLGLAAAAIKQTLFRARTSLIECVRFRMKEQNP
jgi:RNA polymerase sigma-70 factor, ECF subfamily